MTEFLQIGDRAINISLIQVIHFSPEKRAVRLDVTDPAIGTLVYRLIDDDYDAFMKWWEEKAQVYRAL